MDLLISSLTVVIILICILNPVYTLDTHNFCQLYLNKSGAKDKSYYKIEWDNLYWIFQCELHE